MWQNLCICLIICEGGCVQKLLCKHSLTLVRVVGGQEVLKSDLNSFEWFHKNQVFNKINHYKKGYLSSKSDDVVNGCPSPSFDCVGFR